ncbi:MAG: DUF58 domain-containing protein [Cyanobacteriota bacterium]
MIFSIRPIFQAYVLFFVAFFLFLAATNIQGGWLFVIDSLLISLLVFSAIYPSIQSKKLLISRKFKKSINEDDLIEIEVILENTSNRTISFLGVEEEELIKKNNQVLKVNGKKFFISILPKEKKSFFYQIKPDVRGIYQFNNIKLVSDGPFGLFRYTKKIEIKDSLYVYPNVENLKNVDFVGNRNLGYKVSSRTKSAVDSSLPMNIRDYKRGDPTKLIHWKSVARTNKLMVKELETEQSLNVKIFIDTEKNKSFGVGRGNNFEYIIKASFSIFKFFYNKGFHTELVYFLDDKLKKIDNQKSDREINDTFTEIEALETKKFREIINHDNLDKKSMNIIFFSDIEDEDINILNDLYNLNYSIVPFFCKNNTFDEKIKDKTNILKNCKYKFFELEKGKKISDIIYI